jgi:enoyl-[acyl-carrier-protein] reductase (NADH)
MKDGFASILPVGRIGKPREIATAALFLASDNSGFATGIELYVDDGDAARVQLTFGYQNEYGKRHYSLRLSHFRRRHRSV